MLHLLGSVLNVVSMTWLFRLSLLALFVYVIGVVKHLSMLVVKQALMVKRVITNSD